MTALIAAIPHITDSPVQRTRRDLFRMLVGADGAWRPRLPRRRGAH